jgi:hypothetical protein
MQKKKGICIALVFFLVFFSPRTAAAETSASDSEAKPSESALNGEEKASAEETLLGGTENVIGELDLSGIEDLYDSAAEAFGGTDLRDALPGSVWGFAEYVPAVFLKA